MQPATLIISQPGHPARTFEIPAGEASSRDISIGRALDNTICLDGDEQIEHYHALISERTAEGIGLSLSDLGSRTGTTLNGQPVEFAQPLRDGDTIRLGEATIEFYIEAGERDEADARTQDAGRGFSATKRPRYPLALGACIGLALTIGAALLFLNLRDGDSGGRESNFQPAPDSNSVARAAREGEPTDGERATGDDMPAAGASASRMSFAEIEEMCARLASRASGRADYLFDRAFLEAVRRRTADYLDEGFSERALAYRDVVNDAFVGEQGLEAALGFVTAFARSRFRLAAGVEDRAGQGDEEEGGEGLWRLTLSLAESTGHLGRCTRGTLGDADQRCSAAVAAAYMKFLTVDLFAGDFVYSIACFGQSPLEAARFRDGLGADRRDFWKVLESTAQRERVARFFAAGIVGENPQKFGLARARPLTELYPRK